MQRTSTATRFALRGNTTRACAPSPSAELRRTVYWTNLVRGDETTERAIANLSWESATWPEKGSVIDTDFACKIALKLLGAWHGPESRNGFASPDGYRHIVELAVQYMVDRTYVDLDALRYVCRNGKLGRLPAYSD